MLTTASQFTPRARPLHAQHAAAAVRVLSAAAGLHQRQQTRGFRLGLWSFSSGEDFRRESRRRRRQLKREWDEYINQRRSWDEQPFAEDARHALKHMMSRCWHTHDVRPRGRCPGENEDGVRPGQNIEDVERGAVERLMFGHSSRLQNLYNQAAWRTRRFRRTEVLHHTPPSSEPIEQDDYIIDPITNRKVPKHPTSTTSRSDGADSPVRAFMDYWSQFHPDAPSSQTGPEKVQKYDQTGSGTKPQGTRETESGHSEPEPPLEGGEYAQTRPSEQSKEDHLQSNGPKLGEDGSLAAAPEHGGSLEHRPWLAYEASTSKAARRATRRAARKAEKTIKSRKAAKNMKTHKKRLRRAERRAERSADPQQHKPTSNNPHEQFEDLKPACEDVEQYRSQEEHVESRDAKMHQSTTGNILSAQEDSPSDRLDDDHGARHDESQDKTLGFEGEPVAPWLRHHQAPIQRLEPVDGPELTAENLRRKYDQAGLSQHTAAREIVPEDVSEQYDAGKSNDAVESGPDTLRKEGQGAAARDDEPNFRAMLDSLMKEHERLSNAVDEEAILAVKPGKAKAQHGGSSERKLTGNYVRDFPEEFEKSWTQTLSSAPSETAETSHLGANQTGAENMDGGLEGAFGHPTPPKVQPALDRLSGQEPATDQVGPFSKEHQGLGSSSGDGCVADSAQPLLTKKPRGSSPDAREADERGAEESSPQAEEQGDAAAETTSERDDGPTRYRILAYDPVMQKVNMAETTSLVPDFTSALSPADALLRLSQPLKFFPFFAALEAEGFEIVSGSGDVLIFRQARPPLCKEKTTSEASAATTSGESAAGPVEAPVNPIDMTGRVKMMTPASANFASPTGYVNYDNLLENEPSNLPPPPPRIKYNIDVRREEPVFSGPKYRSDGGQKPKKGLFKRLLVGGVWVAGISYGLGVVSEYFATGGIDGMGPKGF